MKLAFVLAMVLTGCASTAVKPKGGIPLGQLEQIRVTQSDCSVIDQRISYIENQLRLRGTFWMNPEDLTEEDRKYNSTGKIIIWSLRIGCSNPDRYK
jgi:hypothetical protein